MRVLAIDTALEACSAALLDTGQGLTLSRQSRSMTRGHAEALLPLISDVMIQSEIDFADIDRVAVTTGPGSFTGILTVRPAESRMGRTGSVKKSLVG